MTDRMTLTLSQADPEVAAALAQETLRQHEGLELSLIHISGKQVEGGQLTRRIAEDVAAQLNL